MLSLLIGKFGQWLKYASRTPNYRPGLTNERVYVAHKLPLYATAVPCTFSKYMWRLLDIIFISSQLQVRFLFARFCLVTQLSFHREGDKQDHANSMRRTIGR